LELLLEQGGTTRYSEKVCLINAGGGDKGAAVQPEPGGTIGGAIAEDFAPIVAAEVDVNNAGLKPVQEVVAQFDSAFVLEPHNGGDTPLGAVPGPVFVLKLLILARGFSLAARPSTERYIQRGMPGRLSGFIESPDDV
jgi:hypothetical protein